MGDGEGTDFSCSADHLEARLVLGTWGNLISVSTLGNPFMKQTSVKCLHCPRHGSRDSDLERPGPQCLLCHSLALSPRQVMCRIPMADVC